MGGFFITKLPEFISEKPEFILTLFPRMCGHSTFDLSIKINKKYENDSKNAFGCSNFKRRFNGLRDT